MDQYREYRHDLTNSEQALAKTFDQYLLWLSSATIIVSLIVLKELISATAVIVRWELLWLAWILLIVSLISAMISIFITPIAFRQYRIILDKVFQEEQNLNAVREAQKKCWCSKIIIPSTTIAFICFILGSARNPCRRHCRRPHYPHRQLHQRRHRHRR